MLKIFGMLCRIVDYTAQRKEIDECFFPCSEQSDGSLKDRGVFFIEGVRKDWLEVLVEHLAIRRKPNNHDALTYGVNVDNILTETVKKLTAIPEAQNGFE